MEIITYIAASLLLFSSSFSGIGGVSILPEMQKQQPTVELGLREVSPQGEDGGFAIPASHCSAPNAEDTCDTSNKPDINVNKPIVRMGEEVIVTWDPNGNTGCALSSTVTKLVAAPNPAQAPNANVHESRTDFPEGMTTYTIACAGANNTDSDVVKVLMEIEET